MSFSEIPVSAVLLGAIAGAAALVYIPFLAVAVARLTVGYDMSAPRAMFDKLPPYAQRATWAHQNSFESFTLFSAAALTAYVASVTSPLAAQAALAYLVARFLYSLFYILNIPLLRSLMFAIGSGAIVTLFGLALAIALPR